jgi:hypothetical protein
LDSQDSASGSLKQLIQLKFTEHRQVPPLKKGEFIRSSGFASLCPREEVLAALHSIIRESKFNADLLLTFALGTDFHSRLQDEILPKIGAMLGEWKCNDCSKHFGGMGKKKGFEIEKMIPKPGKCDRCESLSLSYVEQHFKFPEYGVSGHPDGFIVVPGREGAGVIEAKSISSKGAYEIKKVPKFDHVIQAQMYLWFTGLKWSCLLYWDKGSFGLNALTEHFVERDEETIEIIKSTLKSIWDGLETGTLPPRICSTAQAPRALDCACKTPCFEKE